MDRCLQGIQQKNPICFYHTSLHGILLSEQMYRFAMLRLYLYVTDAKSWGLIYLDQHRDLLTKIKDLFKSKSSLLSLFTNSTLICKKDLLDISDSTQIETSCFIFMKMLYNHLLLSTHLTEHNPNKKLDVALHLLQQTSDIPSLETPQGGEPYKYFKNILQFMYPTLGEYRERVYTYMYNVKDTSLSSDFINLIASNEKDIIIIKFTNQIQSLLLKAAISITPDGKEEKFIDDSLLRIKIFEIMKLLNNLEILNTNYNLSFASLTYTDNNYKDIFDILLNTNSKNISRVGHSIIGTFCGDVPSIVDSNTVSQPIMNVPWNKGLLIPLKQSVRRTTQVLKTNTIIEEYSNMIESFKHKKTSRVAALHTLMNNFDNKYYNTNIDKTFHKYEKQNPNQKIIRSMEYIVYVKKSFSKINLDTVKVMLENLSLKT